MHDEKDQLRRTTDSQQSDPGKVWQETDESRYTGYSDTNVGGSDPKKDEPEEHTENEQIDETQWQGNRFGQGGFGSGQ